MAARITRTLSNPTQPTLSLLPLETNAVWENWTKGELLTVFSIATPVLIAFGALLDRIILALRERNKKVSFDSEIYNANFRDNSDDQKKYGGQNIELVEYLYIKFRIKFFNNRAENAPLHKFSLVLMAGKFPRRHEVARYSIGQSDTWRKQRGLWTIDPLDETTLPSKVWLSVNCEVDRLLKSDFDRCNRLWIFAENDRGHIRKWCLIEKSNLEVRDNR